MKDVIYRDDALNALYQCTPFDPKGIALLEKCESKIEALPSADRPQGEVNAVKLYEQAINDLEDNKITLGEYEKRIEPLKHLHYDRPQEKTISVDTLIEILSDVKEAHRNNSEAEAVIVDVWDEVVDVLRGAKDDSGSID